ncbi:EmrB/QacA subfamily drug resistance transporter [Variovorax sp. TBS-050B]|uniref:MFS transporter n=1 Tax=Variovorax sp. TBS-050B TaxID=2940551 RepID=UPI0024762D0F|nr:MFS transporter [Variovorax sp. TBS-050B]MDH6590462.1 EmrB/QacA subfamily drug resistance transporter [Variovorax sp. TBS-050B]
MANDTSLPSPQSRWVLALAALTSFIIALDALVVTTALSAMGQSFGASIQALEWTVNAYNLSFAVLLMTGAALGDRFGRRRMLVAGLAIFVAASLACALAPTVPWLIAARAVQGSGAALAMPLAMALLGEAFPRALRARALGIFGSVTGLALIVGPAVGGAVAEGLDWRWIFWINLPIGVAVGALAMRRIPESRGPAAAIDLPGVVLVTAAILGVVWALARGHARGWGSLEVAGALAAGLLLALGFVAWERRASAPMMPLALFRSPAFSSGIAATFLLYAPMYGTVFFLPQFLQQVLGAGPLGAGLRLLPWTATLFVVAPIAGRMVGRVGERPLVVCGVLLQAAGSAWIALIAAPGLAYLQLVPPLVMAGAGVSMAMPAAQNAVLGAVAPAQMGQASGTFNMFRYLGGMFGIALLVEVFARTGTLGAPEAFSRGFAQAMGAGALLSLLAAFAAARLPSIHKRNQPTFRPVPEKGL